ncbi:MAG: 50S ribosomal protein L29 [Candidatus Ryanbacteria bacterium RIFCSPHIGHO2_02_FULL_45_13b]|uniref:Large ribosomal subunit protein uL29 n=1 Tax=Candidatus Ryanbacteria bacterium RIFCSPHIGHO2_02_FULL_45_13b TaxID=1802117 RepID=A0A1G2G7N7_9BACT|nr:MAG: 50S ribosomal protein L29 [Candidatus Ryanbacteria bacterium RIFCSPHIGHO2_02_FULL_45_13b]
MNTRDLKEKTTEDLLQMIPAVERQLSDVRFNLAAGRVKNVKEARLLRRTIARVKTIVRERVTHT